LIDRVCYAWDLPRGIFALEKWRAAIEPDAPGVAHGRIVVALLDGECIPDVQRSAIEDADSRHRSRCPSPVAKCGLRLYGRLSQPCCEDAWLKKNSWISLTAMLAVVVATCRNGLMEILLNFGDTVDAANANQD
jgi:hypothetical protein